MLQFAVEHFADTAILRCIGRLVAGDEVRTLQDAVVSQADKRVVLLDLAEVDGIDAAGLGLLMFFQILGRALGYELQLLSPSKRVREMLEITKLDSVLAISPPDEVATTTPMHQDNGDRRAAA
jgi:anti-anti-sigma factor